MGLDARANVVKTKEQPLHFEQAGCNADHLYSPKTGRIIPCPNRTSNPRLFCSVSFLIMEKSLVLNMLCSVLTSQSVYYGPSQISYTPRQTIPDGVYCVPNGDGAQSWSQVSCQTDEPFICSHLAAGDQGGTKHQEQERTSVNPMKWLNSKRTWKVAESITSSQADNDIS
ncbi:hypothetical protein EG68_06398 [Paragonimus skrjabini miyazakii]|uniref:Uncharacterized protein n=1 Tax=Paragonimus skrjabini miyazakii TaxID=59628 RepID=A0A8S9YQD0_9TREM|nr:hypothetical protein EG68_06398 [Paragonimus skrjabini miyazakii]